MHLGDDEALLKDEPEVAEATLRQQRRGGAERIRRVVARHDAAVLREEVAADLASPSVERAAVEESDRALAGWEGSATAGGQRGPRPGSERR